MFNTGFEAILSGFLAVVIAQALKVLTFYLKMREIDFEKMATTGGMPSSHSAGVCALTMSAGLIGGFDSLPFAVSLGYACVVIHDAAGLRHDAGEMAKTLNQILRDFYKSNMKTKSAQLKELLGHTPKEVIAGVVLGCLIALAVHFGGPMF